MNGVFAETPAGLSLIADWNAIYRANADPWDQRGQSGDMARYYQDSRFSLGQILKSIDARGDGLEIGCGHGHALKATRRNVPAVNWRGADISDAAVEQARQNYPGLSFRTLDIAEARTADTFDIIVWGEMLWYVLERIDLAVANCHAMLRPGGALVVSQGFLREQRYGREIAHGFWGAAQLFQSRYPTMFRLIRAVIDERSELPLQHGVLAFRKVD